MFCNTPGFSVRSSKSDKQPTARFRWEGSIKTFLPERNYEGVEWLQLEQDRD
jgi:hypothetical protein